MKRTTRYLVLILTMCLAYNCQTGDRNGSYSEGDWITFDLDRIKQRGKLIALTETSSTTYFLYKGNPMGFEYELLRQFAKHLGVELEIKVIKDWDKIFVDLMEGRADIIASNLTVTNERKKIVNFTEHHMLTRQVLVQRKPVNWSRMKRQDWEAALVRNPLDIAGQHIHVKRNTSFYSRLQSLSEEIGGKINIEEVQGDVTSEMLIRQVANGEITMTVSDENVAMINSTYFPNLDVATPISFPQKIAWAVRKESPMLLQELNRWLHQEKRTPHYYALYKKYFLNPKQSEERMSSEYSSLSGGKISAYDEYLKTYSKKIDWDWRLLAAQVYQESHFNPDAQSWAGAYGLMQLMPATAKRLGFDTITSPSQSIDAAVRFIERLDSYWAKTVDDKSERIKFILASYNVGLGHVIDARNLARKYRKDPEKWEENVDYFLRMKSTPKYYHDPVVKHGYCRGEEPYQYVRQILKRYQHYRNIISDEPVPSKSSTLMTAK
ncbi:MAG: transporter substrate-binding domain-containing protein [Flavobacteriales bacterium]|nr:transporter substrate-binding domain-containing protein [Flavobacteriales bacterium]